MLTTNNAMERRVGLTRKHAGSAPGSVVGLARFMMAEAQSWSCDPWDAWALREPTLDLWQRAFEFKKLFDTNKVRTS